MDQVVAAGPAVQEKGRWPQQLKLALVMLLRKGGKPVDGLQARPITVLPLVYRAWAKVRAKQLRVWVKSTPHC